MLTFFGLQLLAKVPFVGFTDTFTSGSGTVTIPTGSSSCKVRVWGGCGAGGRDSVFLNPGGGGGGGGALRTVSIQPSDWGQTISYVVGASVAGRASNGVGATGNNSSVTSSGLSFTNLNMVGNGGGGGGTDGAVGTGGGATGGTTNTSGADGELPTGGAAASLDGISPGTGGGGVTTGTSGAGSAGRVDFVWT